MTLYTFDMHMIASVTIEAANQNAAAKLLSDNLEAATVLFEIGGETIVGEASLTDDPDLAQVDGVDCIGQYGRRTA